MRRLAALFVVLTACTTPPRSPGAGALPVGPEGAAPGFSARPRLARPPSPPPAFEDAGRAARVRALAPRLAAIVEEARQGDAALAAGVVLDDELVWSQGFGTRGPQPGPVDTSTVFRIGSITKVVTAMTLLSLVEDGTLSLDDPLAKHLPEADGLLYPTLDGGVITLRHLLTHSSGLPRRGNFDDTKATPSEETVLGSLDGFALERPVGERSSYSNVGVGLLSLVIARASGQPFRDAVTARVLRPLGLASAAWDAADVPADRLAAAHDRQGTPIPATNHWRLGPTEGDGGLYLSLADLARLTAHHLGAWPARSDAEPPPLSRATLRDSHRMQVFRGLRARAQKNEARATGVGLAWQVEQSCLFEHLVWHNGATEGYHSALFFLPRRGVGVVVLSASRKKEVSTLARQLLRAAVNEGDLEPRRLQPSPALTEVAKRASRMFELGNLNEPDYQDLFDDGFRRSIPLQEVRRLLQATRHKHGACRFERFLVVKGPRQGSALLTCERGDPLTAQLHLTADERPKIDLFVYRATPPEPAKPSPRSRCK